MFNISDLGLWYYAIITTLLAALGSYNLAANNSAVQFPPLPSFHCEVLFSYPQRSKRCFCGLLFHPHSHSLLSSFLPLPSLQHITQQPQALITHTSHVQMNSWSQYPALDITLCFNSSLALTCTAMNSLLASQFLSGCLSDFKVSF